MSLPVHTPARLAIRPTFELDLPAPPGVVADSLGELLGRYPGQRVGLHLMFTVPEPQRHFWSPYVTIELSAADHAIEGTVVDAAEGHSDGEGGTHLHGRFSPRPSLWTVFGLAYFSLLTLAGFAVMWAVAQVVLQRPPHALWVALGCTLMVLLLWWSSQLGRRLAHAQMIELREAVHERCGLSTDGVGP